MSDPTIIINIYTGAPPCNCKDSSPPQTIVATTQGDRPPPGNSDPPCSSCVLGIPQPNVVTLDPAILADTATGGYPITEVYLLLTNSRGVEISRASLPDAKAKDDVGGTYTISTQGVAQAWFCYTASNGLPYKDALRLPARIP